VSRPCCLASLRSLLLSRHTHYLFEEDHVPPRSVGYWKGLVKRNFKMFQASKSLLNRVTGGQDREADEDGQHVSRSLSLCLLPLSQANSHLRYSTASWWASSRPSTHPKCVPPWRRRAVFSPPSYSTLAPSKSTPSLQAAESNQATTAGKTSAAHARRPTTHMR
jgi:hypothetical protein